MNPLTPTERREALARTPQLSTLSTARLDRLAEMARLRRVAAGACIWSRGDLAEQVFVLVSGSFRMTVTSPEGREVTIAAVRAPVLFGEVTALYGGRRTSTLVAGEPCQILVIDAASFLELIAQEHQVCLEMLRSFALRIDGGVEQLRELFFDRPAVRLARRLLELAAAQGDSSIDGIRLPAGTSQQDLANLVGVSREMVNKQLGIWEDEGLLSVQRLTLTIHRPGDLRKLAGERPLGVQV